MSEKATAPALQEDDLDDLDDVLEDFAAPPASATPARAPTPPPVAPPSAADDGLDDDFLRDLQREMEAMLGPPPAEGSMPDLGGGDDERAMTAMFQRMMQEAAAGAPPPGEEGDVKGKERGPPPTDEDFQETIRRTMAKMRESGEGVKVRFVPVSCACVHAVLRPRSLRNTLSARATQLTGVAFAGRSGCSRRRPDGRYARRAGWRCYGPI
jgi:hypothetical protein